MTKEQIKKEIEKTANEINSSEIEVISAMQAECLKRKDEKTIELLYDIKWQYFYAALRD